MLIEITNTPSGNNGDSKIKYCINVILKEAKEEDRAVRQVFYSALSAYTNNPLNLYLAGPSGTGKNYIIEKTLENFPKEDVVFLAGLTDKAVFHRPGKLVIKNSNGEYDDLEILIQKLDHRIEDLHSEMNQTKNSTMKNGLQAQIYSVNEEIQTLKDNAMKLIDLSHKILVYLDTPRASLLSALMPLLSHDKYDVEYEFADTTSSGIRTKSNVLRGWPVMILAMAEDISKNPRWSEIKRRFFITNPNLGKEKIKAAIELIGKKFSLPNSMYQAAVVSKYEKYEAANLIKELKQKILGICDAIDPGDNNVIIPFREAITSALKTDKAQDMTIAYRLYSYLALLPIVNIEKRPKIVFRRSGEITSQVLPFATIDDLNEAIYLMEYSDGIKPYLRDWYYDVFLPTYNGKTEPDSKAVEGAKRTEERIALTSQELVKATNEIYTRNLSRKQIYEGFIEPLINEGYIDSQKSEINHRNHVYWPVITDKSEGSIVDYFSESKSTIDDSQKDIENNSTFLCKYCEFSIDVRDEYDRHTVTKHPRMAGYPDRNGRTA